MDSYLFFSFLPTLRFVTLKLLGDIMTKSPATCATELGTESPPKYASNVPRGTLPGHSPLQSPQNVGVVAGSGITSACRKTLPIFRACSASLDASGRVQVSMETRDRKDERGSAETSVKLYKWLPRTSSPSFSLLAADVRYLPHNFTLADSHHVFTLIPPPTRSKKCSPTEAAQKSSTATSRTQPMF